MTAKVVDASAIVALLFSEPAHELVLPQLRDVELCAPSLLIYEVSNACLKKIRARPDERAELLKLFDAVHKMAIAQFDIDAGEAIALAADTRLSLYDASYLWLARHLGVELVTLDEKLQKAAAKI